MIREFQFADNKYTREHYQGVAITLPQRATPGSAGYDFYLPTDVVLTPGVNHIHTGVKVLLPPNEFLLLKVRSSVWISAEAIDVHEAIIDSDHYSNMENDGEIGLMIRLSDTAPIKLNAGTRIAQGIILEYGVTDNDVPAKQIRGGGFGSTGKGLQEGVPVKPKAASFDDESFEEAVSGFKKHVPNEAARIKGVASLTADQGYIDFSVVQQKGNVCVVAYELFQKDADSLTGKAKVTIPASAPWDTAKGVIIGAIKSQIRSTKYVGRGGEDIISLLPPKPTKTSELRR